VGDGSIWGDCYGGVTRARGRCGRRGSYGNMGSQSVEDPWRLDMWVSRLSRLFSFNCLLYLHVYFDALTHAVVHKMTPPDRGWLCHHLLGGYDELDEIADGCFRVLSMLHLALGPLREVIETLATDEGKQMAPLSTSSSPRPQGALSKHLNYVQLSANSSWIVHGGAFLPSAACASLCAPSATSAKPILLSGQLSPIVDNSAVAFDLKISRIERHTGGLWIIGSRSGFAARS
jgi:hypothetical protein